MSVLHGHGVAYLLSRILLAYRASVGFGSGRRERLRVDSQVESLFPPEGASEGYHIGTARLTLNRGPGHCGHGAGPLVP